MAGVGIGISTNIDNNREDNKQDIWKVMGLDRWMLKTMA